MYNSCSEITETPENSMVNVLKFLTFFFLFSNKMFVIMAGIHKLLVRKANREDPDQTASSVC